MTKPRKTVFISSTAIDLPEHRRQITTACLERGHHPDGMEQWPAADETALDLCLEKVDQADLFIGIYGHRYGWIPPGEERSITELEYERAVKHGIPRLIFLMGPKHPIYEGQFETGDGAEKLKAFKTRIQKERVIATFDNPDQLRAEVVNALAREDEIAASPQPSEAPFRLYISKDFPRGSEHFLGRDEELALLDQAWADHDGTHVVELIAMGGTGKTALINRWRERLRADGWRGAERVYAWSFYSQGTREDRQASEDHFLAETLEWFGVDVDPKTDPWEKGRLLAEAVAACPTLLLLDGIEPLQYPPGRHHKVLVGELRAPGVKILLEMLAEMGHPGLCVVTSRERLTDLKGHERNDTLPDGGVIHRSLSNLTPEDGARLLHAEGAKQAGAEAIGPEDEELREASEQIRGHALALSLLGRYLALAYSGDIRRRGQVMFSDADHETQGGHAFRIIAAYEKWLESAGEAGARELAVLRLVGFFDRPANAEGLEALRAAPAIKGLTEPLVGLNIAQWRSAVGRLQECGLIQEGEGDNETAGSLDAHPLVRGYLAQQLKENFSTAWREGHWRIYEQLQASVPFHPEGITKLQPLYQAVSHGCLAGKHLDACFDIYVKRILRGTGSNGYYSIHQLGAVSTDLAAVACFFDEPWLRPASSFSKTVHGWLLNQAAFQLLSLGRLEEARAPMAAGVAILVEQEEWEQAAQSSGNLSELLLTLGRTLDALTAAEHAVSYADRSNDDFERQDERAAMGDILHQRGETRAALKHFREADAMQNIRETIFPHLYSLAGFRYCEQLLSDAERAAWNGPEDTTENKDCDMVSRRATNTLEWTKNMKWVLDSALDHLTLARCSLYSACLLGHPPNDAVGDIERAVTGLRKAGQQHHLPRGLLTRAWLRHALGDPTGAEADLAEVRRIAGRGNMRLHLADYHLYYARLFPDGPDAREHLAKARELIEQCEYFRRLPELEDAEAEFARRDDNS